jgi:Protein of unknown function (DUF4230)
VTEPKPARERRPLPIATLAVVFLAGVLVWWIVTSFPGCGFENPFSTETVDRSSPVVLKAIQDLRELRTATGHFEVIVDVEKDTRFVPAAIRGERVLFVAVGTVDAGVDLANLDGDAIDVDDDRRRVEVELPHPRLLGVRIDPERSYVYDRDRGLIDRVASVFQDNPTGERELYLLGEQKLLTAARGGSGLLTRAERNTRNTLVAMLRALGFQQITITFADPDDT